MPPQFVKPYVKSNKNDSADAEAICEAATRPDMHFVTIKSIEQQSILSVNKARERLVAIKTGQTNQLLGILAEFGIVFPKVTVNYAVMLLFNNALLDLLHQSRYEQRALGLGGGSEPRLPLPVC